MTHVEGFWVKPVLSFNERSQFLLPLDGLRAIGALGIVIFHYGHFLSDKTLIPFYRYFPDLIQNGWVLVELFFVISGITFMAFYSESINKKKITFKEFIFKRFSRLIPMQWLTLIVVAVLQWTRIKMGAQPFVYNVVDLYAFMLNLFCIQDWNIYFEPSFNAVSWALSVEILLYIIFFAIVYQNQNTTKYLFVVAVFIGFLIYRIEATNIVFCNPHIARGLIAFFVGAILFEFLMKTRNKPSIFYIAIGILLLSLTYCLLLGTNNMARGGVSLYDI